MPVPSSLSLLRSALLDLALPARCASCDVGLGPTARAVGLCSECLERLGRERWPTPYIVSPDPRPSGLPMVVAVAPYGGVLRRLISAFKDNDRRDLTEHLGGLLGESLELLAGPGRIVVPAPTSRAARRRRGDAPMVELTKAAAVSWPVLDAMRVVRPVADQSGLDHEARRRNLAGAYAVRRRHDLRGREVVLTDDVVTTGATLAESARALRAAGASVVGVATLAATQRGTSTARGSLTGHQRTRP